MSIKFLAIDLYRARQRLEELEHRIETEGVHASDELRDELREAAQEVSTLRRMLDGAKTTPPFRTSLKQRF